MMASNKEYKELMRDAGKSYREVNDEDCCLNRALLLDYISGILDAYLEKKVTNHIASCERCHLAKLIIESEESAFRSMLEQNPDQVLARMAGNRGGVILKSVAKENKVKHVKKKISRIKESLIIWTSSFWEPLYAGQVVTASYLQEQSRQFEMDFGEYINLSCYWQAGDRETDSSVKISWRANLISPSNLWVRFANPETKAIYTELLLGQELEGEIFLHHSDLRFDPASEKWALSIVVEKSEI